MNLSEIEGCEFHPAQDLTKFTTMRLTSIGDLAIVKSVDALKTLLQLLQKKKRSYLVLGWGANQILPARCPELIIQLKFDFGSSYLDSVKDEYHLPASLGLNHLTSHAAKFGLKGWEVFTGVPASLGGAIYMNAGTNLGEIGSLVSKVEIVRANGSLETVKIGPQSFSYRKNHFVGHGDIIVGATLKHFGEDPEISGKIKEYLEYRRSSQPLTTKNCGCVFKNPSKKLQAGRLIDLMGLKNLQVAGLKVSSKHANFIENSGHSTRDDFLALTAVIRSTMDSFYGIEFELEVKIPYH